MLGVMHVGSLTPRVFSPDDVELLQFASDRAAIGIAHARLFAAERAARQRIEDVQQLTDTALGYLEVEELLNVLLPRIRDILAADTCAVLLLSHETNELVARAAVGIEEEVEQGVRIPVGGGFAGRVAAEQRPVILPDVDTAHVLDPILHEKGIKSMLGVPLIVHGPTIGVLHVGTLTHRSFGTSDVELLQLVAERLAMAVERAQLHEETVLLDQLKLNFVAIASHELRTPATSVYGVFATLVARDLPDEVRDELIAVGFDQANRLRRLLEELLDLSRLDAHAIHLEQRPLVVHSVLAQIVADALTPDVEIELDVPLDLAVVADPLVIDRVVSNLVINASRYGKPPFTIRARRSDHHLRISVEDHGDGVPVDLRPRLFDRFARSDNATAAASVWRSPGRMRVPMAAICSTSRSIRAHGSSSSYRRTSRPARPSPCPRRSGSPRRRSPPGRCARDPHAATCAAQPDRAGRGSRCG